MNIFSKVTQEIKKICLPDFEKSVQPIKQKQRNGYRSIIFLQYVPERIYLIENIKKDGFY